VVFSMQSSLRLDARIDTWEGGVSFCRLVYLGLDGLVGVSLIVVGG
jgi:hypothetical protein